MIRQPSVGNAGSDRKGESTAARHPLVVLVGPTGVGKSALAVDLAERFGGVVVSADSRSFYRGMDIGTAKPSRAERSRVPHFLIDVTDPDRPWSVAEFQRRATEAIEESHSGGQLPFLVGGTGQYVRALIQGWEPPPPAPDSTVRLRLEEQARVEGPERLHERLAALDPAAGQRIDLRNVRRVVRALEVILTSGSAFSGQQTRAAPPYDVLQVGLTLPRPELYARIEARIRTMFEAGLVEEVRRLVQAGYGWELPAMSAIGYKQVGSYLRGEISLEEAELQMRRATRRFVRQQANWFRADDPAIHWFDAREGTLSEIEALLRRWIEGRER